MPIEDIDSNNRPQPQTEFESKDRKWRIGETIYTGPFSSVNKIHDVNNGEVFAIKTEPLTGAIRPVLNMDAILLERIGHGDGFPKLIGCGKQKQYKYIIMELVGPDISKIRRCMPQNRFSLRTALYICEETLLRIERLHEAGWLCRDVKAPNFAVGNDDKSTKIYMLDFGFARSFRLSCISSPIFISVGKTDTPSRYSDGKLKPPRDRAPLCGTVLYASMSTHCYRDQGRKDDLESWLYMAIELIKGHLPWPVVEPAEHKLTYLFKKRAREGQFRLELLDGVPKEFNEIMTAIDQTRFEAEPPYRYLHFLLQHALDRANLDREQPLDWVANPRLIEQAKVIGNRGASFAEAKLSPEEETTDDLEANNNREGQTAEIELALEENLKSDITQRDDT